MVAEVIVVDTVVTDVVVAVEANTHMCVLSEFFLPMRLG